MNKRVFLLLLTFLACLAGCNKELYPARQVFSAVTEYPDFGETPTKTTLGENAGGYSVAWVENDEIRINGCRYRATGVSGGIATFVTDGLETPLPKYKACYPYSISAWGGETMSVTLPSAQTEPVSGLISGLPMYAESQNSTLQFKGLCGIIRFGLKFVSGSAQVTSISLKSSNRGLSGACSIVSDSDAWKAVPLNHSATLTLNCNRSVGSADLSYFYVYVPPGDYENLEISITTSVGTVTKKSKAPISVLRSKATKIDFSSLDPGTAGHEAVDLGLPSGLRWATMNIGAANPGAEGTEFTWSSASASSWGGSWRLPTSAELVEMTTGTYWRWTTSYKTTGVCGFVVFKAKFAADKGLKNGTPTGSYDVASDTHIFLPVTTGNPRNEGRYWSSTQQSAANAYYLSFYQASQDRNPNDVMPKEYYAFVRAVTP